MVSLLRRSCPAQRDLGEEASPHGANRRKTVLFERESPKGSRKAIMLKRLSKVNPTVDALLDPSCPDPEKAQSEIEFSVDFTASSSKFDNSNEEKKSPSSRSSHRKSRKSLSPKPKAKKKANTGRSSDKDKKRKNVSPKRRKSKKSENSDSGRDTDSVELELAQLKLKHAMAKQREMESTLKMAQNRTEQLEKEKELNSLKYNQGSKDRLLEEDAAGRNEEEEKCLQKIKILEAEVQQLRHNEQEEAKRRQILYEEMEEAKRVEEEAKIQKEVKLEKVRDEQQRQLQHIKYLETELEEKTEQIEVLQAHVKKDQERRQQEEEEKKKNKKKSDEENAHDDYNDDDCADSQERDMMILDMVVHVEDLQVQMDDIANLHRSFTDLLEVWRENSSEYIDDSYRIKWIKDESKKKKAVNEMGYSMEELQAEIAMLSIKSKDLHRTHHQLKHEKAERRLEKAKQNRTIENDHEDSDDDDDLAAAAPPELAMRKSAPVKAFVPHRSGLLSIAPGGKKPSRTRGRGSRGRNSPRQLPFTFTAEESPSAASFSSVSTNSIGSFRDQLVSFRGSRQQESRRGYGMNGIGHPEVTRTEGNKNPPNKELSFSQGGLPVTRPKTKHPRRESYGLIRPEQPTERGLVSSFPAESQLRRSTTGSHPSASIDVDLRRSSTDRYPLRALRRIETGTEDGGLVEPKLKLDKSGALRQQFQASSDEEGSVWSLMKQKSSLVACPDCRPGKFCLACDPGDNEGIPLTFQPKGQEEVENSPTIVKQKQSLHRELMHESCVSFRGRLMSEYFDSTKKPWIPNPSINPTARKQRFSRPLPGATDDGEVNKDQKPASSGSVLNASENPLGNLSYLKILETKEW